MPTLRIAACLGLLIALAGCNGPLGADSGGGTSNLGPVGVLPGTFGGGDQEDAAAQLAQFDFADTGRIYAKPSDAARGVAAVEFLAASLSGPDGATISAGTVSAIQSARDRLRASLGIAPGVSAQAVVNALFAVAAALDTGDQNAAMAAMPGSVFTLPPGETLQRLGDIPYMQPVNVATDEAASQLSGQTDDPMCRTCMPTAPPQR